MDSVAGLAVGRVEVAAMPSQAVEPLGGMIRRFTHRHPGLSVAVRAAFTPGEVLGLVRGGATEIGLAAGPEPLTAAGVEVVPLGRQRFVLVAPAGAPFTGTVVRHQDLAGQRMIVGQPGTGMRRLVDDLRDGGVDLVDVVETEHREAILPLVLGGVGVALLADSWAPLAERAGARVLDLDPPAYLHLALLHRSSGLTPPAQAFLACAGD